MKQKYITEQLSTPVRDGAAVVVAGGGVAGIAAALSAARRGADVLLIENQFSLGGLATLGLVTIYLPICDGRGHQVIFGIGEELLRLSVKRSHEWRYPECWFEGGAPEERAQKRFEAGFNHVYFSIDAEQLLLREGVRILYGTKICATVLNGDKISALIVENKGGRYAIECGCVVDATGDADVAYFSGAETATYSPGNILAAWYYYMNGQSRALKMHGASDVKKKDKLLDPNKFSGLDAWELSDITVKSHRHMMAHVEQQRQSNPDYHPITIASIPQVRMTRRIVGRETLGRCAENERIRVESSIGITGDWTRRGPIYEIPFGAICSVSIKNLLAAGRDISVTDEMWNVTRVIPTCAVTGQAAGTCAAILADYGNDTLSLDLSRLQTILRDDGVRLHIDEVL